MLLNIDYQPYMAVIGDIVQSKKLIERQPVQLKFKKILEEINSDYHAEVASKFMVTLGDEFQGLLKTGQSAVYIVDKIEREMFPVRLRFGIGIGEITTNIDSDMPLGADGPAYYNARKGINGLKTAERKNKKAKGNISIEIQDNPEMSELLNTIFKLLSTIKKTWTSRKVEVMNAYLRCGGTQMDTAKVLHITQGSVQKALASANFYVYREALKNISNVLSAVKRE